MKKYKKLTGFFNLYTLHPLTIWNKHLINTHLHNLNNEINDLNRTLVYNICYNYAMSG